VTQPYRLYETIDQVPLTHWNEVCQGKPSIYMEPNFIRAVERTVPDQAQVFHAVIDEENGRPGACASLCLLPVDLLLLAGPRLRAVGAWGRILFPNLGKLKVLLCGLPVSAGQSNLAFAPGADRARALGLLDTLMQQVARRHGAKALVFKEFAEEDRGHMDILCQRGYLRADSPAMYEMPNAFASFAAYRDALKAHYRTNIKRTQKKFEQAGCRAVHLEDPDAILRAYTPEVHRLYEAVVAKADVKLELLPLHFFHELVRQLPGRVRLTAVYREGRIIAFGWSLADAREYHFLFCGIDYTQSAECDLYFNFIYHAFDLAFQCGGEIIHVGQTADAFKSRLGCTGKARYLYARGTGPIFSWQLRRNAGLLFPPRQPLPSADVFKAPAASASGY